MKKKTADVMSAVYHLYYSSFFNLVSRSTSAAAITSSRSAKYVLIILYNCAILLSTVLTLLLQSLMLASIVDYFVITDLTDESIDLMLESILLTALFKLV